MNRLNYKKQLSQLKSIAKQALKERIISQEMYDDLSFRIENNEFRITIVGEFSSGKSTLIDALIGQDILPHSTSETTATLTYIHSVEIGHPKENKAEIYFTDGKTKVVDFSELKEYVTAFSKTIDVFSTIEYVDIYIHIDNFDNNIVIVDTPGLNGTNHYEDRTLQEIAKADASVFVFAPSGIKATEQSFMKEELSKHQQSFFYVMNRIDDLHESEGDNVDLKLKELAKDISSHFFDGKQEITKIYGVSALKALAAKDMGIEKLYVDDQKPITAEDRVRFWQESRFECFLHSLQDYLVQEKEVVFINSLVAQLAFVFQECLQQIEKQLLVNAPKTELPAAAIIEEEIKTAKARFDSYKQGLDKNVNARMGDVESHLKVKLKEIVRSGEKRCAEVEAKIATIKTIEEFHRIYGDDGSKASTIVASFYDRQFDELKKVLEYEFQSVGNDMLKEIKNLIPNIRDLRKREIDSVNIGKNTYMPKLTNNNDLLSAQTNVQDCQERIDQLLKRQEETTRKKDDADRNQLTLQKEVYNLESQLAHVNYRISILGSRPEARRIVRTRETKKERAWYNPLRVFGKYKTVTEEYIDYDRTEQYEYDRKRQSLDSERSSLNNQLLSIQRQIDNLPDLKFELQRIERDIQRKIDERDYQLGQLQKAREAQQREMAAGREAFLNRRKHILIKALQEILTDDKSDMYRSLKTDTQTCINEWRVNLTTFIRSYFDEESGKYLMQLKGMLNNLSSTIENKESEQKRNTLNLSMQKVNKLWGQLKEIII